MSFKWIGFVTLGTGLLWTYLLLVLFLGDTILGVHVRLRYLAPMILTSFAGTYWLVRWAYQRQWVSAMWLKNLTVASIAILLSMIAADIGYSVYLNVINPDSAENFNNPYYRLTERQVWFLELFPRRYYPTEKNFLLYKPNVTMSGNTYGGNYYSELMEFPTVANSVLELRHISYSIDEHGFRETTPLEQAHIFALGDSFTFGNGITQDKTWVELLEQAIGEPIYSLGVIDTSPKQQLMILKYMLQTKGDSFKIRHLLWMIFEANDLEDSYETLRPIQVQKKDTLASLFRGTLLDMLASIPGQVSKQSVINRFMTGRVSFALPFRDTDGTDPYLVDGMRLMYPLYHSTQYGYRLFPSWITERANKSESYILEHPNRPLLDQTFRDMASLSRKYGFRVTVLIAPSASRLYAPYFGNFPPISEEPYFINYVERLTHDLRFNVINLYRLMQPYARESLLYWCDDPHWNERGNEVVAEIIVRHFMTARSGLNDVKAAL